jgi:UDPglucose--hexose-1-phosphate uridylyltransferase
MPRIRQNIITKEWVVIAPERSQRPQDFVTAASSKRASKKDCPFCIENNVAYKTSIKKFETDNVYVIPNLYPAFVDQDEVTQKEGDYYPSYKSLGGHDVIILKDHDKEMGELKNQVLEEYYHTYQRRIDYFNQNPTVEYSMIIHNFGPEAGASIVHPHSQLMASSIIPTRIEMELRGSEDFYREKGECVFCWLVKKEQEKKIRVVGENRDFLAFTFWAARFPFEIWVVPKEHNLYFEKINRNQRLALADIFKQVLSKLNDSLNNPPYNYYIHTGPPRLENEKYLDKFYHWHIEIAPRVNTFGGYELGSSLIIDVVSPERAAMFLNKKSPQKEKTFA